MGCARFQTLVRCGRRVSRLCACSLSISASLLAYPAVALGQEPTQPCKEIETSTQPAPEDATNLIELQSNAARPTFDVELAFSSSGADDISFTPKARKRLVGNSADVAAEFTDAPRFEGHRLKGDNYIAAHASKTGRQLVLEACFEKIPSMTAGRYEGTVSIYGPRLSDFTYAIVVTTKLPRWVPIATILATVLFALIVAMITGQLAPPARGKDKPDWKGYGRVLVALVLAVVLAALPYWSVYASNETWGSTFAADMTALVTATFAGVVAAFATAKKLLS